MNKSALIAACAAFAAGTTVGWLAKSSSDKVAPPRTHESEPRKKLRVADSKSYVKTVTTVVTNTVHGDTPATDAGNSERPRGPGGFMAELERAKIENPERYAAMTNRMAQFRNQMMRNAENKLETLAAVDTTGWNKKQIETHEKYQDLIARREELIEIVRHDSGVSEQERRAAFDELRDLGREIRKTSAEERNILLDKTFRELGYNGADAREIRETVKTIYSTTEEWGGFGRHGRGGANRHGR